MGLLGLPRRGARPPRAGTRCKVAGWGSVSDFEELPPGLMEAEVRVLELDACNSSWKGQLSPAMLCTHSGDHRRRGFCSVRCSFSVLPACCVGKLRPSERSELVREPWQLSPSLPLTSW